MSKKFLIQFLNLSLTLLLIFPSFYLKILPVHAWTETDEPIYSLTIGGYTEDGQLNSPKGVAVDSDGNIYVADTYNYRIQKFDSSGNFLLKFGSYGTGDGQFKSPYGIDIDSNGYIYVGDDSNYQIQKFDSSGNFLLKFGSYGTGDGQFESVMGICVDSSNNVYVADYTSSRVQKFDSSGNLLMKLGSYGTGDGQFRSASAVSVDSNGNIYVADRTNRRVQKFDSSGNFLLKFGSAGTGDGQFSYLQGGLTVDSNGNVYVADIFNYRIQKFTSTGMFQLKFGTAGNGDGQFNEFRGIIADSTGHIYVADTSNHRIQKFDSIGNFQMKFGSNTTGEGQFNKPYGIVIDIDGNVYVADYSNHRIQRFNSSGVYQMKLGSYGSENGQFSSPYGVAVDLDRNVYVADTSNHRIQKFNSSGEFQMKFGSYGTGNGQFKYPYGVVVDAEGNIYVADFSNNRVQKFNSSGVFQMKFGSVGHEDGQFFFLSGITVDSNGNIYVADTSNDRIQKFNASGEFQMKFGSYGTADGQFNKPFGIAIDSNNYIYVADSNNNRIQKFNSLGEFQMKFGSYGIADGQFNRSNGVAVDTGRNVLYITDTYNYRVQKFVYDKIGPTGIISVNNGGAATSSQEVRLNLAATDDLSGVYQMIVSEDSNFNDASWEDYATAKNFTLSSGEGEKTVYVKYVDNRTNYSEVVSDSIFLDLTGPTGTISINSDETITNTDEVTLTLTAIDNLSGISKMMVSNKGDYSGGTWETYNTSKEWRLSMGDGEKRVYVKYRDEVGNISSSNSDSIEMDMGAPTGTLVINEGEEYTSSREVVLHITGEDEVTGVEEMRISEDRTMEGVDWEGYETSREYTLSEGDGYKVIYIQYRDGIGNESEVYGSNITLDRNTEIDITEIGEEEVEGEIENWETEETTPTFTGEGEVGATITIEIEGIETGTVIVNEDGVWSWTPSIELTRGGKYNVTITSTDLAGNEDTQTFTLRIADEEVIDVNQTTPEAQTTTTQLPNTGLTLLIMIMICGGILWNGYNFKVIEKLGKKRRTVYRNKDI